MTEIFQDCQRTLQDQFDSHRLADRIEERLQKTELSAPLMPSDLVADQFLTESNFARIFFKSKSVISYTMLIDS